MRRLSCVAIVTWIGCHHADPVDVKVSPNGMEMVSLGALPRQAVHYSLTDHEKSIVELALEMNLTAGTMGGAVPTVAVMFQVAVEGVMPTGHANVRMTVLDAVSRDRPDSQAPAASTAAQLDALKGISIIATIAPDGKLSNTRVDPSAKQVSDTNAAQVSSLIASFQQVTMPLPDVPLGIGATWKSSRAIDQAGMKMTAVNTVTLTKLEGSRLTFSSTAELHGDDQTVTISGVAIRIEHVAGTGEGHGTISLDRLTMTGEINAMFKAEMSAQDERTPMQVTTKLTVTPN